MLLFSLSPGNRSCFGASSRFFAADLVVTSRKRYTAFGGD